MSQLDERRLLHEVFFQRYERYVEIKASMQNNIPKRQAYIDKIYDLLNNVQQQERAKEKLDMDLQSMKKELGRANQVVDRNYRAMEILFNTAVETGGILSTLIPTNPGISSFQQQCLSHLTKIRSTLGQLNGVLTQLGEVHNRMRSINDRIHILVTEERIDLRFADLLRDLNQLGNKSTKTTE
jgi:hypothetical protein